MVFKVHLVICILLLGGFVAAGVYSFKRCGWGMFAYESAFIAALTGECAQQQRKLWDAQQMPATGTPAQSSP